MNTFLGFINKLNPKTYISILLLILAVYGAWQQGIQNIYLQLLLAISTAVAIDVIISYIKKKQLIFPSSAFITGIIIAMVLSPNIYWYIPVIAAAIAILQKHIIRFPHNKPAFNPAAFGLLAVILLFHTGISWWGQSIWWLIIAFGLFISYKTKKLIIPIIFIISCAIIFTLGNYLTFKIWNNPFIYVNFFFVFVMLIEPKTSPYAKKEQYIYSISAAILSYLFFLIAPMYDYSIFALVTTNLLMCIISYAVSQKMKI
jgi:Na+-translocating ferredoxin:NAD+ oxidoreductase RnfD subunit